MRLPVTATAVAVACSLTAPAFAQGRGQGQGQGQAQPKMRFAAMDSNRDGVITRAEWRGSERSFQTHDWNNDKVLSGDEVRPGGRRAERAQQPPFDSAEREYPFADWTAEGFRDLDHDRNGRITRDEWHFDIESFRRADHDGDGVVTRAEFLNETAEDDDREDRFEWLDANNDARISRDEWHGTAERFSRLDSNRDGALTRAEMRGGTEPPPDLFTSLDVNRNAVIEQTEWHWSATSFRDRDTNRDGRLTRAEFAGSEQAATQQPAYKAGYERGLSEGRAAGREDRERNQGWDLEGQRELEAADSGYEARLGPKAEYQAGYREGFRRGYREGWGR